MLDVVFTSPRRSPCAPSVRCASNWKSVPSRPTVSAPPSAAAVTLMPACEITPKLTVFVPQPSVMPSQNSAFAKSTVPRNEMFVTAVNTAPPTDVKSFDATSPSMRRNVTTGVLLSLEMTGPRPGVPFGPVMNNPVLESTKMVLPV